MFDKHFSLKEELGVQRRKVKYGVFLSLVTIITIILKKKSYIESTHDKKRALEQDSKRIEELTIMEERKKVSQDLHENIGHIFTSVITSLDALPFLMKKSPEEVEKNINEISNLARKGLDKVRKIYIT